MMTALSHRLPPITWRSNAFQRVVNAVAAALFAGWTRRYERHSLVGRAELRKRKL
jgi:hypothetical protein